MCSKQLVTLFFLIVGRFFVLDVHAGIGFALSGDVSVDTRAANIPPYLNPTILLVNASSRQVTLAANAGDTDGSIVSYSWVWPSGSATGSSPMILLPYGTTLLSVTVVDDDGASSTASVTASLNPLASIDSDGDGLDDLAEYTLRNQGFDWNQAQPQLVDAVASAGLVARSKLATEGYYDLASVRAILAPAPVISRDSSTGKVRLTLGIQQSSSLSSFEALPATSSQVSLTPEGKISFEFDAPTEAGFYRIEVK